MTPIDHAIVWRKLHVIVRDVDTCAHLLRAAGLGRSGEAHDTILAAGTAGFIPSHLAHALAPAAGLRNRLVHEYDKLDDAQVHAAIGEAVRLLPQFAAAVEAYLDRTVRGA